MSLVVDIHKKFDGFSLDVAFETASDHETLALLGPSGCGKSLTLRCIAGILRPDAGRIVLNGRVLYDSEQRICLPPQQRRVGYVFQHYALFPTMTVARNIACGVRGCSRPEREDRVAELLTRFRLDGLEQLYPRQLSGGQQQRVALARILVGSPDLLLLDEPFSALDEHLRWELELELADTLREFPGGSVYVSHNRDEVWRMCDSVCVVANGKAEPRVSTAELFRSPQTVAAARISGCKNITRAEVISAAKNTIEGTSEPAVSGLFCPDWGMTLITTLPLPQATRFVGVRSHHIRIAMLSNEQVARSHPQAIRCTVERVIDSVFTAVVMLKTPAGALLRYESEKDAWAPFVGAREVLVWVNPDEVMPLEGGSGA